MMRLALALLAAAFVFLPNSPPARADHKFRGRLPMQAQHHGHLHGGITFSRSSPYLYGGYRSFSFSVGGPSFYRSSISLYDPYCYGYSGLYGTYYNPQRNSVEYYLPPVYYPAELSYGPQALKQFLGLPRDFALEPLLKPPLDPAAIPLPADEPAAPRVSNAEARRRAASLTSLGDDLFRKQRYQEALQQFKSASRAAPDLAEHYFRQGHALVATNRYELAVEAFKRGLEVEPGFVVAKFKLDEIYGTAKMAKHNHVEALAREALDNPRDADLLFLLGVFIHFDGESDRAQKFFARAAEMSGDKAAHIRAFIPAEEAVVEAGKDI